MVTVLMVPVREARRDPRSSIETLLERSSVGAYDDPRIKGVPSVLNLGVPILQDGIAISSSGGFFKPPFSVVRGLGSSPGCVMTILKPPGSDSRATLVPGRVESEWARR